MPIPHKHAALIKAWADGEQIQYWYESPHPDCGWKDFEGHQPHWSLKQKYRIKPERVFPESSLTFKDAAEAWIGRDKRIATECWVGHKDHFKRLADAAIKQYILDQENGNG